jgi:hypothetical protein
MAKKRPEFSFPELEHRGRNAILRSPEEVQAEEALLDETEQDLRQSAPTPEVGKGLVEQPEVPVRARTRASRSATTSSSLPDRLRQKLRSKQHLTSYTFRFRAEELEQLDQLVTELNQSRTTKLSKNDLARLAVSWLLADYEDRGSSSLAVEVAKQE